MPTPIAHSLFGAGISHLNRDSLLGNPWWDALLLALLANAADLDYLPGLLVGEPNLYHQGLSHTLGMSVIIGAAMALLLTGGKSGFWNAFIVCSAAYGSHILLDFLNVDTREPIGIMALWPFSDTYFNASAPLFPSVSKSSQSSTFFVSLFSVHNLRAAFVELVIMTPLYLASLYISIRRKDSSKTGGQE